MRSLWWRVSRGVLSVPYLHRFFQLHHFREGAVRVQIRFAGDFRRPSDPYWWRSQSTPAPSADIELLWHARVAVNVRRRRIARRLRRAPREQSVGA